MKWQSSGFGSRCEVSEMFRAVVFQGLSSYMVTGSAGQIIYLTNILGQLLLCYCNCKQRTHGFYCFVMNDQTLSARSWLF